MRGPDAEAAPGREERRAGDKVRKDELPPPGRTVRSLNASPRTWTSAPAEGAMEGFRAVEPFSHTEESLKEKGGGTEAGDGRMCLVGRERVGPQQAWAGSGAWQRAWLVGAGRGLPGPALTCLRRIEGPGWAKSEAGSSWAGGGRRTLTHPEDAALHQGTRKVVPRGWRQL